MADPRTKSGRAHRPRPQNWVTIGLAVCLLAAMVVLGLRVDQADAADPPVLAVNFNGPATTADGIGFSASAATPAVVQSGGFQLCSNLTAANPPVSAELLAVLNCFVWGSAGTPLAVAVSGLAAADYDVFVWVVEDNFLSPSTLSINGAKVADLALAAGGDWQRLGPFRVTAATGFQLTSALGDANVAALAVYPVGGGPATTSTLPATTSTTQAGSDGNWSGADFLDERVAGGVGQGLSADWLPDGRLLTLGKTGTVGLVDPVAGSTTTLFTIPNVDSVGEHGAMDIAVAPDFATTGQFYVYYSATPDSRLHIDRFVLGASGTATAATRTVIWTNPGRNAAEFGIYHIGGSLNFGPDGRFYLSIGDAFQAANGQDLTNVFGKVLRINRDGTIPADNPFVTRADPNTVDEIWLYGVRNPFRASWDLDSNRYLIGDVGGNNAPTAYEELNVGVAGGNYGWSVCEGPLGQPKNGATCPAGITPPIHFYAHDAGGGCCDNASITGGELFDSPALPAQLARAYIFGDYARGTFSWATIDDQNRVTATGLLKSVEPRSPVWISEGPDGHIYYVSFNFGGNSEIRRLRYTGDLEPPASVGAITADPPIGGAPLTVQFSVEVDDPLGRTLQYLWDFGDGTTSTEAAPVHVYGTVGLKRATVKVTAGALSVTSEPVTIQVGIPPKAIIDSPAGNTSFDFGERFVITGHGEDDEPLPADALRWEVMLVHADHVHPVKTAVGPSVALDIDTADHALASDQYFRVTLSVTDNDGLVDRTSIDLNPRVVSTSLRTNLPAGATVGVQGVRQLFPFTVETAIGYRSLIEAPPVVCIAGERWVLDQWSNGAAPAFTWQTPTVDAVLEANYRNTGADVVCPVAGTLRISPAADRSGSVPLNGATFRNDGAGYLFFAESQAMSSVRFRLDDPTGAGPVRQQELVAPYDFAGGSVALANPFDLSTLSPGTHSVRVDATRADGSIAVVVAEFTVDAAAPPLTGTTTTSSSTTSSSTTSSSTTSSSTTSTTAATTSTTSTAPAGPRLLVSARNDRAGAVPLSACTLARDTAAYVFAEDGPFTSVQFRLDGTLMRTELFAPWDFAGGGVPTADPWNPSTVPVGTHVITALATLAAGGTQTVSATFTVSASGPSCFDSGSTITASTSTSSTSTSSTSTSSTSSTTTSTTAPTGTTGPSTTTTTTTPGAAGSLRVSLAANRSGAVPLQGWAAGTAGNAYIFLDADPAAVWVDFWLDDTTAMTGLARHRELFAPWDFVSGGLSVADPLAVASLGKGEHTVSAKLRKPDGTEQVFSATFTI